MVFTDPVIEIARLDLLDLVSNCHEAGKELSKDLSAINTSDSSPKSYQQRMDHSYRGFFSYAGKTGKNPKRERMVDASNYVIQPVLMGSSLQFFVTHFLYDLPELDSFACAKMYERSRWENNHKYDCLGSTCLH